MKRLFMVALVLAGATGCTTGLMSRTGIGLVTVLKEPMMVADGGSGEKVGKACSQNIMGLAAFGDSSLEAAKAAGGIKTVAYADAEIANFFLVYGQHCTIAHGE